MLSIMKSNHYVSVIVPNYCHAKYLDQRFESILNQTYQNFELIILDDCSPDDGASRAVIEKYRDNPHVSHIVYNEVNSGSTFKQWEKGMNLAKGELVWIAESDDYCEPTLLERLTKEFENDDNLSLAYCRSQKVDADGNPIKIFQIDCFRNLHLSSSEYVRRFMLIDNHCENASACLFRKDVALNIGKEYMNYVAGGDYLFWVEIAEKGNVVILKDRLNYFRQHNNKVTPHKVRQGINAKEAYKTANYILTHFPLNSLRRNNMLNSKWHNIINKDFESNMIRNELLDLWGFEGKMNLSKQIITKLYKILCHRFEIYI